MNGKFAKIFALIDCNSFYASCERVFRPDLKDKPVAVLSNNDGCIVAMTKEVKDMGVERGSPYFKIPGDIRDKIFVFSSNYTLYGDMSRRVMNILTELAPGIEIYSIDESFIDLTGFNENLTEFGKMIRKKVITDTGIPVSVGIGHTKTLAKLANHIAKKNPEHGGVFDLTSVPDPDKYLNKLTVNKVWGVGRKNTMKLNRQNFRTVRDLKYANDGWIRKNLGGVTGLRTVWELRGIPCIEIETVSEPKKSIVSSRSFGKCVGGLDELKQAVSSYIATAARKLRKQNSLASSLSVFINTDRFKDRPQYRGGITYTLPYPVSSTIELTGYALNLLGRIYRKGYLYKKAGIMLDGIIPGGSVQYNLFTPERFDPEVDAVMDAVNSRYGDNSLYLASSGIKKKWSMRRQFTSPHYTTDWNGLLKIKI